MVAINSMKKLYYIYTNRNKNITLSHKKTVGSIL